MDRVKVLPTPIMVAAAIDVDVENNDGHSNSNRNNDKRDDGESDGFSAILDDNIVDEKHDLSNVTNDNNEEDTKSISNKSVRSETKESDNQSKSDNNDDFTKEISDNESIEEEKMTVVSPNEQLVDEHDKVALGDEKDDDKESFPKDEKEEMSDQKREDEGKEIENIEETATNKNEDKRDTLNKIKEELDQIPSLSAVPITEIPRSAVPNSPQNKDELLFQRRDEQSLRVLREHQRTRRLLLSSLILGVILLIIGSAIIMAHSQLNDMMPLLIVGIVIIICAIACCGRSVYLGCKMSKGNQVQHDQQALVHWIQPEVIPYGWGHTTITTTSTTTTTTITTRSVESKTSKVVGTGKNRRSSSLGSWFGETKLNSTMASIPKDIFDESARYSDVIRPSRILVEPSSPTDQRRGSFLMEEDRIINIFKPKH